MASAKKVAMFDLCAGIGGFSHALRPVARTVAYAERDPSNIAMLRSLGKRRLIPSAPVFTDVAELTKASPAVPRPGIICAGFPCQDVSIVGAHTGLHGPRTSLFFTVAEVVGRWKPALVFLENVPPIVAYMPTIEATMKGLGYTCHWDIFSAGDLGAPHLRRRWYCLCRRTKAAPIDARALASLQRSLASSLQAWGQPPPPSARVISGSCKACPRRLFALGNSIVPQCAQHAFLALHARAFGQPPPPEPRIRKWSRPVVVVPPPVPRESKSTQPAITKPVTLAMYHTPRAAFWVPPHHLTRRGVSALASQLSFQEGTPKVHMPRVNPGFVEWMMGYPPGYTRLEQCDVHK